MVGGCGPQPGGALFGLHAPAARHRLGAGPVSVSAFVVVVLLHEGARAHAEWLKNELGDEVGRAHAGHLLHQELDEGVPAPE
jgi:hypothetical protein